MSSRKFSFLAVFVLLLFVSSCSIADPRRRECDRYVSSLRNPSVLAFLEEWRQSLPAVYDKAKLKRASNELFGIGIYTIPLGFNPGRIGLRSTAEVRLNIGEDGKLSDLVITDVRGSMFYFLVDDNVKYFERVTLPDPRSKHIGVMCLRRD